MRLRGPLRCRRPWPCSRATVWSVSSRRNPRRPWCLARPAAAGGGLIFADAAGELLGVDAEGARRRAVRPRDGWLALGGVVRETGKPPPADPSELDAVLAAALTGAEPGAGPVAVADPAGRRLRVGSESWLAGEAEDGAAAAAGAA